MPKFSTVRYLPVYIAVAGMLSILLLAGCGVKPAHLSPPAGSADNFPRTYPDPATDPQP
jgi:hypothetical protein